MQDLHTKMIQLPLPGHQTEIRVRGFHLDVYRHVNNARYLEFLEEARWHYFDEAGLTPLLTTAGCGMAVINIDISYRRSAGFGDDLLITTAFSKVQARKVEVSQTITLKNTGQTVVQAQVVFVAFDLDSNRAISFPAVIQQRFAALLQSEVSRK
ncbi:MULTISPECIES: thioesterase family protein [Snodgrassella]|uniref:acyl-CoA thioesterase n=1 Tax=Snodgrassella TaxID=1193515 RepID=UPI00214862D1|nr:MULTISPECIES: thioesterase family protein [Snodgrassella]